MPDHIHLYVAIPAKYARSDFMGYLREKSSLMIFDRHANRKCQYGSRYFWCSVCCVDTIGRNGKAIREYVRNQLQEDIATVQISLEEFKDPFTGEPTGKGKKSCPRRGQPVNYERLANLKVQASNRPL